MALQRAPASVLGLTGAPFSAFEAHIRLRHGHEALQDEGFRCTLASVGSAFDVARGVLQVHCEHFAPDSEAGDNQP